ncbi:hypothetical protein EJB05_35327, partial [Eragrostis curvula]
MAFNKKAIVVIPLILLLVAYCAEAVKICTAVSQTFTGDCVSKKSCASACHQEHEGRAGGYCTRKRFCPRSLYDGHLDDIDLNWPWPKRPKCKHLCKCSFACGALPAPSAPTIDPPPMIEPPPENDPPPATAAPPGPEMK